MVLGRDVALCWNRSPLDDVRVRRAFALGTDREQLANEMADFDLLSYTGGLVPPGVPGHSPGIALPYDPSQARHLLAMRWVMRHWHNKPYESLVERARRGAMQAERMNLYGQADRMLVEEAIVVPWPSAANIC